MRSNVLIRIIPNKKIIGFRNYDNVLILPSITTIGFRNGIIAILDTQEQRIAASAILLTIISWRPYLDLREIQEFIVCLRLNVHARKDVLKSYSRVSSVCLGAINGGWPDKVKFGQHQLDLAIET